MTNNKSASQSDWPPKREAALARLAMFVPDAADHYTTRRNYDSGQQQRNEVSQLSPWVRHRLVTEKEILTAVLAEHSLQASEKFIQEVFWRGYFKGWLEHRPAVWKNYQSDLSTLIESLNSNADLENQYNTAIDGHTGIECFDHWCGELKQTGYLHNHARMWFASIWINTLKLPWQLGADFFYRHLLDGDQASNTCSWRWVCGLHTRGKTYLARAENIEKYTSGRFKPITGLADSAEPLDEPLINAEPIKFDNTDAAKLEDHRVGFLITEEDCSLEACPADIAPKAILAVSNTSARSPLPASEAVRTFSSALLEDTLARTGQQHRAQTQLIENPPSADPVVEWATSNQLDTVVTARMPIGPACSWLEELQPQLQLAGINLTRLENAYDKEVWPHASKGFFALKKKIPAILKSLAINHRE